MGGYASCRFLPSESEPTQSSIPLLGDASGRRRNPPLPWVGRSSLSTCTFSLISDLFPIRGYVAVLADMPYGRRPTVPEPCGSFSTQPYRQAKRNCGLTSRRGWLHSRRRRQGSWWAPRSSKPMWGRELPGGFDSRPPPPRFDPYSTSAFRSAMPGYSGAMSAIARLQTFAERAEISFDELLDFLDSPSGRRVRNAFAAGLIVSVPMIMRIPGSATFADRTARGTHRRHRHRARAR